jgi:hypothetical protein
MPIPEDLVDVVEELRSQFWTLVTAIAKKTPEYTVAHLMQYAHILTYLAPPSLWMAWPKSRCW